MLKTGPHQKPHQTPHWHLQPDKHHVAHWGDLGINLFTLFRSTDKLWVWCAQGDRIGELQELRCFGSILHFE